VLVLNDRHDVNEVLSPGDEDALPCVTVGIRVLQDVGHEIVNFRPVRGVVLALANRRLQPLGHLTAARNLSYDTLRVSRKSVVPKTVSELSLPLQSRRGRRSALRPKRRSERGGSFRRQPCRQLIGARRLVRMSRAHPCSSRSRWRDVKRSCIWRASRTLADAGPVNRCRYQRSTLGNRFRPSVLTHIETHSRSSDQQLPATTMCAAVFP
jgi:hypothetical protein